MPVRWFTLHGRSFLWRMIDLLAATGRAGARKPFHRLNREFRSDLAWWRTFIQPWNGVGLVRRAALSPQFMCTSDASGVWGCGSAWFQLSETKWLHTSTSWDISAKELLPIVLASAVWDHLWSGAVVQCHCDNQAVVAVL